MRYTAIHTAEQARHARHAETVELGNLHAALANERVDGTIDMTTSSETFVQRIVYVLQPCQARVGTPTVLEEYIESTRLEYPLDVPEGTDDIGDATQRPGGDDTIKASVGKR